MSVHKDTYLNSIRVFVSQTERIRIENGPLRATGGRGKAPWVRQLILKALAEDEALRAGKTQFDIATLQEAQHHDA